MSDRKCDDCRHYINDGFLHRRGCEVWNCEYEPKDEWIPCSERMPKESESYLVTLEFKHGNEVEICNWIDGEWFEKELAHAIVAWKYLPEPWKGAKK